MYTHILIFLVGIILCTEENDWKCESVIRSTEERLYGTPQGRWAHGGRELVWRTARMVMRRQFCFTSLGKVLLLICFANAHMPIRNGQGRVTHRTHT